MSHPLLSTLGFGAITFDEVEALAAEQVHRSPGSTAVYDDRSGIRVVLPDSSKVGASTLLVRSTSTTPCLLTWKSRTTAGVRLTSTDGNVVEFDAAVGDWSLLGQAPSGEAEMEIGAVAVKANIERIQPSELRRKRRNSRPGKATDPMTLKPLERKTVDGVPIYHLSGTVLSWTLKANRLTRGTWYQVLLDSVVPITVAIPVSVGKIAVGNRIICDVTMCVSFPAAPVPSTPAATVPAIVTPPSDEMPMSVENKTLLALGFATGSRDSLVAEARKASQKTKSSGKANGDRDLTIDRYEDASGAVLLLVERQPGSFQVIPLVKGNVPERMEKTAGPLRGQAVLDLYNEGNAVTRIPAHSDDYWSAPGSVTHHVADAGSGLGALAVDVKVSDMSGHVLRKMVPDSADDGRTWISGKVTTIEPQLNELTGLEWYKVTVDTGVPVTVALPETVSPVPEPGNRLWGNVRFCVLSDAWDEAPSTGQSDTPAATTASRVSATAPTRHPLPAPEEDELDDIDDIDGSPDAEDGEDPPVTPGNDSGNSAPVTEEPETMPSEPTQTAESTVATEDVLAGQPPLPRGWLSYIAKVLGKDRRSSGFTAVTVSQLSGPFIVADVSSTSHDPTVHRVHIERRFPLTTSFCNCGDFTRKAVCGHLYPAFHHVHSALGEEGTSVEDLSEELFNKLGPDPSNSFFRQYASNSQAIAKFAEAVQKNHGDSIRAIRDVIEGIAESEAAGTPSTVQNYVYEAINSDRDMLPVLHKVVAEAATPSDDSQAALCRVIDLILSRRPNRERKRAALRALPVLFTMPGTTDEDRKALAALIITLVRRGSATDMLPFLTAADALGTAGAHMLQSLLDGWQKELSVSSGPHSRTGDKTRLRMLSRLTVETFGTVQERVTFLRETSPPELATAVLLLEGDGRIDDALQLLRELLKIQPKNVTTITPYQLPLHDALQLLIKHGRKKTAAKVARQQFRENPCWDSYLDLEEALRMTSVADSLQERDQIVARLDDTDELTLDEVDTLVRLRLRAREFGKALAVMEGRELYGKEWAADTEELRNYIRNTIGGHLPDRVVDLAIRDAELALTANESVDASGLKTATETLYTGRATAERVGKSDEFSDALASFRKAHRTNSLLMAFLDGRGLARRLP